MKLRSFLSKNVLDRNYYLARIAFHYWLRLASSNKRCVLIYSMGKVGSSTIAHTLEAANLGFPVYQLDTLTPEGIRKDEAYFFGEGRNIFRRTGLPDTRYLLVSHHLRQELDANRLGTKGKVKIVTLVREPIARNISDFFETITFWIPDFYERLLDHTVSVEELQNAFLHKYDGHDVPLTWYDKELKAVFGIDVFAGESPRSRGYAIYENEISAVLLLRLESLRDCYQQAFNEFMGCEDLELLDTNVAAEKVYYSLYRDFVESVALPRPYIDKMYTSRYATHFYSEQEISNYFARWLSHGPDR